MDDEEKERHEAEEDEEDEEEDWLEEDEDEDEEEFADNSDILSLSDFIDKKTIFYGGPVKGNVVLLSKPDIKESEYVADGLYFSRNTETLDKLDSYSTSDYRVFTGLSVWYPGQLENELNSGMWFLARCHLSQLFTTDSKDPKSIDFGDDVEEESAVTKYSEIWGRTLRLLGGEFQHFALAFQSPVKEDKNITKEQTFVNKT
eukprot:TRINITY_DN6669_c0_g1_i1.p1 TRINITY_DN6669_c0_g1~~TRINITY_DN6669_c0_g1_i1.p1  ORF type:complete len:202 (+),score=52.88 TRINITY_DN6669_c0_g1_i1:558-1163(+)